MKKSVVCINFFLLAALLGACGYRGQVTLPDNLKRIHLTVNNTGVFRPGVETDVRQALTQRILNAGGQVVTEKSRADVTMKATLTAIENNAVAFTSADIASRFRMVVVLDLEVIQRNGKEQLAKEQVRGEAYYSAPKGIRGTEVAENNAIRRAIRDLADEVMARVVEPF